MEQPVSSRRPYTVDEYFRMEAETDARLEYIDGRIYSDGRELGDGGLAANADVLAMSGGSVNHSQIVSNVGGELRARLKGNPCRTFDPGLRVRANLRGQYVHPDVTVVCGPVEVDAGDGRGEAVLNPRLVIEVLSPSTEVYDRLGKAELFRGIASLQEYVLVSQDGPRAETSYRNADGVWSFGPTVTDPSASLTLRSVGVDLPMAEVYARVAFPPRPPER